MAKLYELLIRLHPDGRVGAAAYFYKDDGETPDNRAVPLHTDDFPSVAKKTIADLIGPAAVEFAEANVRLTAERDAAIVAAEDARAEAIVARQEINSIALRLGAAQGEAERAKAAALIAAQLLPAVDAAKRGE